jgi:hypothetical protein
MNIHQVSVSYVQEQDRMLLRINSKDGHELRAWLTRRLTIGLLPVLNRTAAEQIKKVAAPALPAASLDEQRQQLVVAFEKEAALRQGDFATPYSPPQTPPAAQPLGAEPLLLTEIKITLLDQGQLQLQLFEKFAGKDSPRSMQLMMDPQLTNGLLQLLHQGLQLSHWLDTPPVLAAPAGLAAPALPDASDTAPAELPAGDGKPKYLN